MARIRTIKPEFFEDEDLASLPPHDRLMFIGTWLLADRNGVLEYRPRWIQTKVFPYETGDAVDASRVLPRLVSGGFLIHYEVDGREYLQVVTFTRHQRINGKEAQSQTIHPLPSNELAKVKKLGSTREAPETEPDHPGCCTESQEGKGREGKGGESRFEEWWGLYRRKGNKKQTVMQWEKLTDDDQAAAIERTPAYVASRREVVYQKDGERFLRDRVWEDVIPESDTCPHPHGTPAWMDWYAARGTVS